MHERVSSDPNSRLGGDYTGPSEDEGGRGLKEAAQSEVRGGRRVSFSIRPIATEGGGAPGISALRLSQHARVTQHL